MSSPTTFDTAVHYGVIASTGAALSAGAVNDWSAVVMALILVPFGVIALRPNALSEMVFGAAEAVGNLLDAIRPTRGVKRIEDPGWPVS